MKPGQPLVEQSARKVPNPAELFLGPRKMERDDGPSWRTALT